MILIPMEKVTDDQEGRARSAERAGAAVVVVRPEELADALERVLTGAALARDPQLRRAPHSHKRSGRSGASDRRGQDAAIADGARVHQNPDDIDSPRTLPPAPTSAFTLDLCTFRARGRGRANGSAGPGSTLEELMRRDRMRRSYLVGAGAMAVIALAVGATIAVQGPSASKEAVEASCPQPRDTVIPEEWREEYANEGGNAFYDAVSCLSEARAAILQPSRVTPTPVLCQRFAEPSDRRASRQEGSLSCPRHPSRSSALSTGARPPKASSTPLSSTACLASARRSMTDKARARRAGAQDRRPHQGLGRLQRYPAGPEPARLA